MLPIEWICGVGRLRQSRDRTGGQRTGQSPQMPVPIGDLLQGQRSLKAARGCLLLVPPGWRSGPPASGWVGSFHDTIPGSSRSRSNVGSRTRKNSIVMTRSSNFFLISSRPSSIGSRRRDRGIRLQNLIPVPRQFGLIEKLVSSRSRLMTLAAATFWGFGRWSWPVPTPKTVWTTTEIPRSARQSR